ncbi:MAG: SAM-dependent methyltransferase [Pirellulaceae bacterium]|nr:MAG: SAM-dependent methyltransferase [Pirellulaceae bacterium]
MNESNIENPSPRERPVKESRELLPLSVQGRILWCSISGTERRSEWFARETEHMTVWFLDAWHLESARRRSPTGANERLMCSADLPEEQFDVIVLPVSFQGEAELVRELIQQSRLRLAPSGQLWASVDNPHDDWLHKQLAEYFRPIQKFAFPEKVIYRATPHGPVRKLRSFRCEFPFRDNENLLWVVTRPGVFAHRRVDAGARRLMEAMAIEPGMRILEIGSGSGAVSLAAAARQPTAEVTAVDSVPRAVECLQEAARRNALDNISAHVFPGNDYRALGSFDLVLTNPPYYGRHEIAERFVAGAAEALVPGGELLLVAKNPSWYLENLQRWYRRFEAQPVRGGYWIVRATR